MAKRGTPETTKKKQEFVREMVGSKPGVTMNQVGIALKKQYGTQLAFDKLRKAYATAGGKIDTRRGPKKGSKLTRKKKAGARRGRPKKVGAKRGRKPSAATAKKVAFVAAMVTANPGATMNAVGQKVKAKFGTQLAFNGLRNAFKKAGGKVGKPGRKPGKGSGRKTARGAGRRKVDRAAQRTGSVLGALPRHIVVIQDGRSLDTQKFNSRAEASLYAEKRIGEGVAPSRVAYYEKSQLKVQIGL